MARKNDEDEFNNLIDGGSSAPERPASVQTTRQQSAEEKELDNAAVLLAKIRDVKMAMKSLKEESNMEFYDLDHKLESLMDTYFKFMHKSDELQKFIDDSKFIFEPDEKSYQIFESRLDEIMKERLFVFKMDVQQDLNVERHHLCEGLYTATTAFTETINQTIKLAKEECSCLDARIKQLEKKEKSLREKKDWGIILIHDVPMIFFTMIFGSWGLYNYAKENGFYIMAWAFIFSLISGLIWDVGKYGYKAYKDS